ncbi:LysR family transcriptional regulator [Corynebacterium neomassiliense]|uniref:LysR family transcriptional regulator n=1 Tax=Corynebacterium neomassiliense TaxID=2079482 RepID=UPI001030A6BF|nr:LysR family transcriptional regulator [Corynebacterium neomassiliense]
MLNVHRLTILRELARRGTLAEVARVLNYSPSAVSHQLARLEKEAGVPLLEPVGRGVKLTDAARLLVARTDEVLTVLDRAEAELAASSPRVSGTLRVTAFHSALASILPTALTLVRARHPELQVEVFHREIGPAFDGLAAHLYDLVIGDQWPDEPDPVRPGMERQELFTDPLLLVTPSDWPGPEPLSTLAEAPWAIDPEYLPGGRWVRRMLGHAGIVPKVLCDTDDPLLQAHLVRTGHAVAVIPSLLVGTFLDQTRAQALPGSPARLLYTAVREGQTGHPAVRAFRAALASAARRESPEI